jgi:hypothetical protein
MYSDIPFGNHSNQGAPPMNDDKKVELLMDHYRDTYEIMRWHWKARNRIFALVLLLLAIIGVDSFSPGALSTLTNSYLASIPALTGAGWKALDFTVIDCLARFLLMCLVVHYYQRSITVDRLYKYLHRQEERICMFMGGNYIIREGEAYFSRKGDEVSDDKDLRPMFLRCISPLYIYVFPLLVCTLVLWKLIAPYPQTLIVVSSAIFSLAIVFYSVLYIVWGKWRK